VNSPKIRLAPRQKEKLLRNMWLLHDSRWFHESLERLGLDDGALGLVMNG
jgi:hypothetical protein